MEEVGPKNSTPEFGPKFRGSIIRIPEFDPKFGHPQTCVYPDVCLGIAHVSGKAPLPGQGGLADTQCICPFRPKESVGRKGQIQCVSTGPLVPREGLYQIHGQSLNTHRGKHRSGGAQQIRVHEVKIPSAETCP